MADEEFPDAVREIIRSELPAISVCTFAVVADVSHHDQRLFVRLKNDPEWADGGVPVVTTGASAPGGGDVPGLRPGHEVLVVFTADDTAAMLAERGSTPDAARHRLPQNAIAIPFSPYTDDDSVPAHEPGERLIAHPNGSIIRFGTRGNSDLSLEHPTGITIELDSSDPEIDVDPAGEATEHTDPRESPDRTQGVARLSHPSGVGVTVHEGGISITPGDRDGDDAQGYGAAGYDDGPYGAGGREQGVQTYRDASDPWRVEMVGDHTRPAEGHRHLVPHADGTVSLTGPPVPQRAVFAWFCENYDALANSGAPRLENSRTFYENWLAWLEATTGNDLDPSPTPDTGTEWPYPEPVPDAATRDEFRPGDGTGFGYDGFGDDGMGE